MYCLREQQDPASRTYRIHCNPDQCVTTHRQDGRIRAPPAGQLPHRNYQVGTRGINAVPQAVTCRYCKPLRIQIGSDYHGPIFVSAAGFIRRTSLLVVGGIGSGPEVAVEASADARIHRTLSQYTQHDTDRTLTYHYNRLPNLQTQPFDPLHARVDRLQKTGLLKGNIPRNSHRTLPYNPVHHAYIFGKPAARGFESRRAAHLLVRFALGKSFASAIKTVPAGEVMKHHHPVARLKFAHSLTHGCNHT